MFRKVWMILWLTIVIHSFIPDISALQVHYCSEALQTTARLLCWSFTPGNCEWRTCSWSLRGARVGFAPMTIRTKGDESTNDHHIPRPYLAVMLVMLKISYERQATWIYCKCFIVGSIRAESMAASRLEQTLSEVASSIGSSTQPKPGPQHSWMLQTQIWLLLGLLASLSICLTACVLLVWFSLPGMPIY